MSLSTMQLEHVTYFHHCGSHRCIHCVYKKEVTKLMMVILSNLNRFAKFFHWQTHHESCSKVISKDSTTTKMCQHS